MSAWSPVPSPFRLLVPLAGLGGMPSPASSLSINSSSVGDRPATAPRPCPVVDVPARAGPGPQVPEQGSCKLPQAPSVLPTNLPRFRAEAQPPPAVPSQVPADAQQQLACCLRELPSTSPPAGWAPGRPGRLGGAVGRAEGARPLSVTQPRGPAEWSPRPGTDLQGGCSPRPVRAWPGAKPVMAARRAIQALNLAVHDCMVCGVPVKPTDNATPAFSLSSYSNPCCKCAT